MKGRSRRVWLFGCNVCHKVLGLIIVAVVVAACSKGAGGDEPVNSRSTGTTAFQQEMLADGFITEDELERATFATVECVREAGASASEPVWRGELQTPRWDWGMNWPHGADSSAYDDCDDQFLRDVQGLWVDQHRMTEAEEQEARETALECMSENGYPYPDYASFRSGSDHDTDIGRRVEAYCMSKAWNHEILEGFLPE